MEQRIPLFHSGNLVKFEMLEMMKDYEVEMSKLQYTGYRDGIVRGLEITTNDNVLTIKPGILLIDGNPFYVTEEIVMEYRATNTVKCLVAHCNGWTETRSYQTREVTFELCEVDAKLENDIELCRFRLQAGARLRDDHKDFADMDTEYDTVCLIHAKWAGYHVNTLAEPVLRRFAKEVSMIENRTAEDRMFINQIMSMNGTGLALFAINNYLSGRLEKNCMEYSVEEAFRGLVEAKNRISSGKAIEKAAPERPRRIFVD